MGDPAPELIHSSQQAGFRSATCVTGAKGLVTRGDCGAPAWGPTLMNTRFIRRRKKRIKEEEEEEDGGEGNK